MDIILVVIFTLNGCHSAWATLNPFYVWPLSPENPTGEIVTNSSTGNFHCTLGSDGHPNLDYNGLKLQGCEDSYADVDLATTRTIPDFSILVFVSPEGSNGTVLHYAKKIQRDSSDEIINIILLYETVTTSLYITDRSNNILKMASLVSNFQTGVFTPILIIYDSTSLEEVKVMYLYVGTVRTMIKINAEDKILGLPGKMRVGGSYNPGYTSYNGRVTCLQFYDTKITYADYDAALDRCMSTLWPTNIGGHSSAQQTYLGYGHFHLISRGEMPQPSVTPVSSFNSSSRVKCASSCTLPSHVCVSFTFNKVQKICDLFDLDYSGSLINDRMKDYYVIGCCN